MYATSVRLAPRLAVVLLVERVVVILHCVWEEGFSLNEEGSGASYSDCSLPGLGDR